MRTPWGRYEDAVQNRDIERGFLVSSSPSLSCFSEQRRTSIRPCTHWPQGEGNGVLSLDFWQICPGSGLMVVSLPTRIHATTMQNGAAAAASSEEKPQPSRSPHPVKTVPEQLPLLKDRRRPEYEAGICCGWRNKKEPTCTTNTLPGLHTSAKLPAWWSCSKYRSICQCQRSEDRSQQHLMRPQQILCALQKKPTCDH